MKKKSILVPVDFSAHQEHVVTQSLALAESMNARLILLHCATPPELSVVLVEPVYIPSVVLERFTRDHTQMVSEKMAALSEEIGKSCEVETMVRAHDPASAISAVAEEMKCDLIVMGSHGAGLDRFLLGSVAELVIRNAPCPVVVAREQARQFDRVVVGIDFSSYSRPLVELARSMCPSTAEIHLMHAWQPPHLDTAHLFGNPGHASLFGGITDGIREHASHLEDFVFSMPDDSRYVLHVDTGRPASLLLDLAKEIDAAAVFVGAHDSEGLEKVLGTVADRVIRHGETTVLLTEAAISKK